MIPLTDDSAVFSKVVDRFYGERDSSPSQAQSRDFGKASVTSVFSVVTPYFVAEFNAGAGYVGSFSRVRLAR
jgi:hypothetical protein